MTNTLRVLVVDGLAETEAVLKAVLEPQGASVSRQRSGDLPDSDAQPPQLMVVDLDDHPQHSPSAAWPHVPRVVLGSTPVPFLQNQARFLEKPFQYPELIRVVQCLLDLPSADRRAA